MTFCRCHGCYCCCAGCFHCVVVVELLLLFLFPNLNIEHGRVHQHETEGRYRVDVADDKEDDGRSW